MKLRLKAVDVVSETFLAFLDIKVSVRQRVNAQVCYKPADFYGHLFY